MSFTFRTCTVYRRIGEAVVGPGGKVCRGYRVTDRTVQAHGHSNVREGRCKVLKRML